MKKKICRLVISFVMIICCVFSFVGCSLIKTDKDKANDVDILTIGNTTLTKADLITQFYTYYQSNSSYFAYYTSDVIEESFYTWVMVRQIISEKAEEELYDAEKNADGKIVYTKEDEEDVWKSVYEYVYSQLNTYEKAIYKLKGWDENNYPAWLQNDSDEDDKKVFKPYESTVPDVTSRQEKIENATVKSDDNAIKNKVTDIKDYLFKFNEDPIDESRFEKGARNQAYAEYISSLVTSAKSNGKNENVDTLFFNEVKRVYEAYYTSKLSTLFQNYYTQEYLLNTEGNGDTISLSDKVIAKTYLEKYFTDLQNYQVEDSYISKITNKDGASVVLYHYNGSNYFFTVQHILVPFDDYLTSEVKKLHGYDSTGNYDFADTIAQDFINNRNELADKYTMLTTINTDNEYDSITIVGNHYYYDENLEGDENNNYGYILLDSFDEVVGEETITHYFINKDKTGSYDEAVDTLIDDEDVKYMASADDIYTCFENSYASWKTIVESYISAVKSSASTDAIVEGHDDMAYIFDMIDDMLSHGATNDEILEKVTSLLFVQIQWIYSGDTLGNEVSNKIGYVVSNYPDENGNWVSDFANGARELIKKVVDGNGNVDFANIVNGSEGVSGLLLNATSNYGVHIMKIENIYKAGSSLVDMSDYITVNDDGTIDYEVDLEDEEVVAKIINSLKKTYISTSSNETLYDYLYDELYVGYAGNSSTSGTYFLALEYEWLNQYHTGGKIVNHGNMSYDDLIASIN